MKYLWMIFRISLRKGLPRKGIDGLTRPRFYNVKNLYCVLIFYQLPHVCQDFNVLSAGFVSKRANLPSGYGHSLTYCTLLASVFDKMFSSTCLDCCQFL